MLGPSRYIRSHPGCEWTPHGEGRWTRMPTAQAGVTRGTLVPALIYWCGRCGQDRVCRSSLGLRDKPELQALSFHPRLLTWRVSGGFSEPVSSLEGGAAAAPAPRAVEQEMLRVCVAPAQPGRPRPPLTALVTSGAWGGTRGRAPGQGSEALRKPPSSPWRDARLALSRKALLSILAACGRVNKPILRNICPTSLLCPGQKAVASTITLH